MPEKEKKKKKKKKNPKTMYRGAKTIKSDFRGQIATLKNHIRFSTCPFDGDGYVFKTAVSELRKEGLKIVYDKEKCHYILCD